MSHRRPSRCTTIPSAAEAAAPTGPVYPFGDAEPASGDVMEIVPGLRWVRIAVPGPLRHVNCWLLDDADVRGPGVALVDTGMNMPGARDAWRSVFRGPLTGVRVTRIIGTHFHPDHIGLAGWMADYHDAPILMTRTEWLTARLLVSDARDDVPEGALAFWRAAGWNDAQVSTARERGWSFFSRLVTPLPLMYERLVDGRCLTIGEREWRVVIGSGHSPEHSCLFDEEANILIAGDQVLPRISPNVSLGLSEPGGDPLGDWFASIKRLRALPADVLILPGHGDPFTGLHPRLAAIEQEHRERLDTLWTFCNVPRRATDCFATLFSRPIGQEMLGMASGEALAHLRRLEVEGRAVREDRDGVWWYHAR